jgi:FkbM family methyltransferase
VHEFHLPGLLVEPLPDMFGALRQNYAGEPQLLFENVALGASAGTLELIRFRADAPVDDDLHGLASADIPRMERFARFRGIEHHLERVNVPCITFEEFLHKHGIAQVDLLVMDVEGHEWALLQAAFRAGIQPRILFMEFIHLTPHERWQTELFLADHGYTMAYCGIDLIALHPGMTTETT